MDALDLLLTRSSHMRLTEPAPAGDALKNILQAGVRVPDHACLSPWKFIVCSGDGLARLGDVFSRAAQQEGLSERDIARAPELPLRAPMVIVAATRYTEHPKVPKVEQIASTACAVQSMQMAAIAQGFDGIWRTGHYAQSQTVKLAMSLFDEDEIVGFLYLGTKMCDIPPKPVKDSGDFVEYWS